MPTTPPGTGPARPRPGRGRPIGGHRPDVPEPLAYRLPGTQPGSLALCVGPAGAGKSTYLSARYSPSEIVSRDALRLIISGDGNDQSPDVTIASTILMRLTIAARLQRGLRVAVDVTGSLPDRVEWARFARWYDARAELIVFDVPIGLCLSRQAGRPGPMPGRQWGRAVPADVVRAQHTEAADVLYSVRRWAGGASQYGLSRPDVAFWHTATVVTVYGLQTGSEPRVETLQLPTGKATAQ